MNQSDVVNKLRVQPFEPFRLILSNGHRYDVLHLELVMVTRSAIYLFTPSADVPLREQRIGEH